MIGKRCGGRPGKRRSGCPRTYVCTAFPRSGRVPGTRDRPEPSHFTFRTSPFRSALPLRINMLSSAFTANQHTQPRNTCRGGVLKSVTQTPSDMSTGHFQTRSWTLLSTRSRAELPPSTGVRLRRRRVLLTRSRCHPLTSFSTPLARLRLP